MTTPTERPEGVAYGACWCGCGEKTRPAAMTSRRDGWVKGGPLRYIHGHNGNRGWNFAVRNCGYATPCHIWLNAISPNGYPRTSAEGKGVFAHIVAWKRANGSVPEGLVIDHLCRVKSCVRPDHLEAVTQAENVRRGSLTKLSKQQALCIRDDPRNQREIASEYEISQPLVSAIKNGHRWVSDMDDAELERAA